MSRSPPSNVDLLSTPRLSRLEQLKHRIHKSRIPLNSKGQTLMTCVYIVAPMLVGYVSLQWILTREESTRQLRYSKQDLKRAEQDFFKKSGGMAFQQQVEWIMREAKSNKPFSAPFGQPTNIHKLSPNPQHSPSNSENNKPATQAEASRQTQ